MNVQFFHVKNILGHILYAYAASCTNPRVSPLLTLHIFLTSIKHLKLYLSLPLLIPTSIQLVYSFTHLVKSSFVTRSSSPSPLKTFQSNFVTRVHYQLKRPCITRLLDIIQPGKTKPAETAPHSYTHLVQATSITFDQLITHILP